MQDFAHEGVDPAVQDPPAVIVKTEPLDGTSSDHSASGNDDTWQLPHRFIAKQECGP